MSATSVPSTSPTQYYLPVRQLGLTGVTSRSSSPSCRSSIRTIICGTAPAGANLLDDLARRHQQRPQHPRDRVRAGPLHAPRERPVEMRPSARQEFVNGVAAMSASGTYGKTRVCAALSGTPT